MKILCQAANGSRFYAHWKLDESNTVLEQNCCYGGGEKYPTKILTHDVFMDDFNSKDVSMYYNIYYCQE